MSEDIRQELAKTVDGRLLCRFVQRNSYTYIACLYRTINPCDGTTRWRYKDGTASSYGLCGVARFGNSLRDRYCGGYGLEHWGNERSEFTMPLRRYPGVRWASQVTADFAKYQCWNILSSETSVNLFYDAAWEADKAERNDGASQTRAMDAFNAAWSASSEDAFAMTAKQCAESFTWWREQRKFQRDKEKKEQLERMFSERMRRVEERDRERREQYQANRRAVELRQLRRSRLGSISQGLQMIGLAGLLTETTP